jgi:hypothetical protein
MSFKDFFQQRHILLLVCLVLLGVAALVDFLLVGNSRRTMVFYSVDEAVSVIEDRMISRVASVGTASRAKMKEEALTRYVDEVLLGPIGLDIAPLFIEGTRLESLFYRDNDVFVNLTEEAVFAPLDGFQDAKENLSILVAGIKRNFSYVDKVVLFIDGNEVFFDEYDKYIDV